MEAKTKIKNCIVCKKEMRVRARRRTGRKSAKYLGTNRITCSKICSRFWVRSRGIVSRAQKYLNSQNG